MAYRIIWSPESTDALDRIIVYLQENWYDSDVQNFLVQVNHTLQLIQTNPYLFRYSVSRNMHEALITKHNLVIYEIDEKKQTINLLTIIDTRSNPKRKQKQLRKK